MTGLTVADTVGITLEFEYYESGVVVKQTAELTLIVEGLAAVAVEFELDEFIEEENALIEAAVEEYTIDEFQWEDLDEC